MGASSCQSVYARLSLAADRVFDFGTTLARNHRRRRSGIAAGLIALAFAPQGQADTIRIATYNTELSRKGPGLLLRDILKGDDPQVEAVAQIIASSKPDIIALQCIDWDLEERALLALKDRIAVAGHEFPYHFSARPNSGLRTGFDHDGNGRNTDWADAQGFGRFAGECGMAVLSRLPLNTDQIFAGTAMRWSQLDGADLPTRNGGLFPDPALYEVQRLSSVAHWAIPVTTPTGATFELLTWHGNTPVFDGPEDMNGRRGGDELRLWHHYVQGRLANRPAPENFVIAGVANIDPADGEGQQNALLDLLALPNVQVTSPASDGAAASANPAHAGNPALDTVDWSDPEPGNLRVSYVLPSARFKILQAGTIWPAAGTTAQLAAQASRHRLVWADLALGPGE